jgi:hypothetical protein
VEAKPTETSTAARIRSAMAAIHVTGTALETWPRLAVLQAFAIDATVFLQRRRWSPNGWLPTTSGV